MNVWTNVAGAAVWIAFSGRLVETPMDAQNMREIMGRPLFVHVSNILPHTQSCMTK